MKNAQIFIFSVAVCASLLSFGKTYQIKSGDVQFSAKAKAKVLKITGEGAKPTGEIQQLDQKVSGRVKIDLKDLATGIDLRDQHMKNKYLQVEKYPTAELEIQSVDLKAQRFSGILDLHGNKKPVRGDVKIDPSETGSEVESHFQIQLSDFQIETPSFMEVRLLDTVDVTVQLSLAEVLASAAQGSP